MIGNRGPRIVTVHRTGGGGNTGLQCCCFSCCTCLNLKVLKTEIGVLKLFQLMIGLFCQSLAVNFGFRYSENMGASYQGFLTAASWCMMTTGMLLLCYIFSEKSVGLIRQSLFETLFNSIACFSYISSCSFLGFAVNTILYPLYLVTPYFQVYPAMTAAYIMGTIAGIIHGYDAYKAYKFFRGFI